MEKVQGFEYFPDALYDGTGDNSGVFLSLAPLDDLPKKKPPLLYKPSNPDTLAYLDFSVSTTGMLAGVKVNHF